MEYCGRSPAEQQSAEPWRATETTKQMVNEFTSKALVAARDSMLKGVAEAARWLALERRYHAGEMSDAEREALAFKPTTTAEENARWPDFLAHQYYRELWHQVQQYCIGLLHAYEGTILLYLRRYLPQEQSEYWRTRDRYPVGASSCAPVTVDEVCANNARLCEWRAFDIDVRLRNTIVDAVPTPELTTPGLLEARIEREQPWSPTCAQMQQFHSAMNTLFRLPADEIKTLFDRRNAAAAAAAAELTGQIVAQRGDRLRVPLTTVATPQSSLPRSAPAT